MKIVVRASNGPNIFLPIPSGLVFNRFTAGVLIKTMKQNGLNLDKKQALAIIKAVNAYRRKHRDWVLVEVDSADGDYVKIKL